MREVPLQPFYIDYGKLAAAESFYDALGYCVLSVPWIIPAWTSAITKPPEATAISTQYGDLVGSAEQGFLHMAASGLRGKYVATSPCFRDEREDEWHTKYFMKTELFQNEQVTEGALFEMIDHAKRFFMRYTKVEVVKLSSTEYDIQTLNGIELGSYGIRFHEKTGPWVYGTGCAEPRLTKSLRWEKEHQGK